MELIWGNEINIIPDLSGVDTLFFQLHNKSHWDTLLIKISHDNYFRFIYNACCDYFDVMDSSGLKTTGKISFHLSYLSRGNNKYLGSIGDDGVILNSKPTIITPKVCSTLFPTNV